MFKKLFAALFSRTGSFLIWVIGSAVTLELFMKIHNLPDDQPEIYGDDKLYGGLQGGIQQLAYVLLNKEVDPAPYDHLYWLAQAGILSFVITTIACIVFVNKLLPVLGGLAALFFCHVLAGLILGGFYQCAFDYTADIDVFTGPVDSTLMEFSAYDAHLKGYTFNGAIMEKLSRTAHSADNIVKMIRKDNRDADKNDLPKLYLKWNYDVTH